MATLEDARMPSLRDKQIQEEMVRQAELAAEKKVEKRNIKIKKK